MHDKQSRILETLTISTCVDCVKKLNKTFVSDLEHLLVFKALRGADQEQYAGTIQESNKEHLLFFEAQRADKPRVPSGTPPCF